MQFIIEKISNAANKLGQSKKENNDSLDFTTLRELSQFCLEYLIRIERNNKENVIAFFLYTFIDKLINNFGGDTVYDEKLQNSKTKIYNNIIESLNELSNSIVNKNDDKIYEILSLFIITYYEEVNYLNKIDIKK